MASSLTIRRARDSDIPEVSRLFYETVQRVNSADYRPSQIAAWAPHVRPTSFWRERWQAGEVWLALEGTAVAGFAELRPDGEVDCFYVHWNFLRRGVGQTLMRQVFRRARALDIGALHADVSLTAYPFFLKMGFREVRQKVRDLGGESFEQYEMICDQYPEL